MSSVATSAVGDRQDQGVVQVCTGRVQEQVGPFSKTDSERADSERAVKFHT